MNITNIRLRVMRARYNKIIDSKGLTLKAGRLRRRIEVLEKKVAIKSKK